MNPEWRKLLAREGVDITTISGIDVVFYDLIWQVIDSKEELFFTHLRGRDFTHYIGLDPKKVGRAAYQKYFNSIEQIVAYYEEGKKFIKDNKTKADAWQKKLGEETATELLAEAFKDFRSSFETVCGIYSIISWLGIEAWQADFEDALNKMIARNGLEKETEKILAAVYQPWKKTALIEIQEKLAGGADATELATEYQFLRSWSVVWYKPITKDWMESIKNTSADKATETYTLEQIIEKLKPSAEEASILQLVSYIVFFKDWRDDLRRMHAYQWSFLFDHLAKQFNLEHDDVGYLSLDEIEQVLTGGQLDAEKIQGRKATGCIVTASAPAQTIQVIDGVPDKYQQIITQVEQAGAERVVKGKIAQMGIVRGIVRLIRSHHDIKRVQEGDVLVANTTHPDYLPAMKKAVAFVTNEGGMISHAAIVAREMKKPCIVGTSNATKILMEGDLVEVDGDKGIVRIIK